MCIGIVFNGVGILLFMTFLTTRYLDDSRYNIIENSVKSLDDLFSSYFQDSPVSLDNYRFYTRVGDSELVGQGLVSDDKTPVGYLFVWKDNSNKLIDFYLTVYSKSKSKVNLFDVKISFDYIKFEDPTFRLYNKLVD